MNQLILDGLIVVKQPAQVNEYDLVASLQHEWLKLPLAVMRDVGPAAQTLGALLKLTTKETFVAQSKMQRGARLTSRTIRRHLVVLEDNGWLNNAGRGRTRTGVPRRTCTWQITKKTIDQLEPYGLLPWWAALSARQWRFSWAARAVLSVVMARLLTLKATAEKDEHFDGDHWEAIERFGGHGRFLFSLSDLTEVTGLHRESLVKGKRELAKREIIEWYRTELKSAAVGSHVLFPSRRFLIQTTPAKEAGWCNFSGFRVAPKGGRKLSAV